MGESGKLLHGNADRLGKFGEFVGGVDSAFGKGGESLNGETGNQTRADALGERLHPLAAALEHPRCLREVLFQPCRRSGDVY